MKVWCWGGKRQVTHTDYSKHWVPHCTPVMKFYCGKYKGKMFTSYRTGKKFHACEVCVHHFFWSIPPINDAGCWMNQLTSGHWCGPPPAGVSPFAEDNEKEIYPKITSWLKAIPTPEEVEAYWNRAAPTPPTPKPKPTLKPTPRPTQKLEPMLTLAPTPIPSRAPTPKRRVVTTVAQVRKKRHRSRKTHRARKKHVAHHHVHHAHHTHTSGTASLSCVPSTCNVCTAARATCCNEFLGSAEQLCIGCAKHKGCKEATPAPTRRPTRRPTKRPTPAPTKPPLSCVPSSCTVCAAARTTCCNEFLGTQKTMCTSCVQSKGCR